MTLLITGMLVLIGIHLLPSFVSLRQGLIGRLGWQVYQAGFALIALAGLILIVVGMSRADFVALWQPPAWGRQAALILMLPALFLLVGAYLPSNIRRITRHPMLWGVTLWSTAHLLANGDLASLILFGGLGAFALFDMASANRRGAAKQTALVPCSRDFLVLGIGVIAYVVLLYLHPYLFGVKVMAL